MQETKPEYNTCFPNFEFYKSSLSSHEIDTLCTRPHIIHTWYKPISNHPLCLLFVKFKV